MIKSLVIALRNLAQNFAQNLPRNLAQNLARTETGTTGVEYALLASLIGAFIVGSLMTVGLQADANFAALTESLKPNGNPPGSLRLPGPVARNSRSDPPDYILDFIRDTESRPESEADALLLETAAPLDVTADASGLVVIPAKALLAAARGSNLGIAPAAGAVGGRLIQGAPAMAASETGSAGREISWPWSIVAGYEILIISLFGLLSAILGLFVAIRKVVQRARLHGMRESQLREWHENRENEQSQFSGELFHRKAVAAS